MGEDIDRGGDTSRHFTTPQKLYKAPKAPYKDIRYYTFPKDRKVHKDPSAQTAELGQIKTHRTLHANKRAAQTQRLILQKNKY